MRGACLICALIATAVTGCGHYTSRAPVGLGTDARGAFNFFKVPGAVCLRGLAGTARALALTLALVFVVALVVALDGAATPDAAGRRNVAVGGAGAGRNVRGARRGFRAMRTPG